MPANKRLLLPALFFLTTAWSAQAADRALIVGVGAYANPNADLTGIDLDVDMAKQIARHLGYKSENIKVLRDQQATVAGMREQLQWLAKNTSSNDNVMIYFSGHGSQIEDKNGDELDGLDETLYMHDGHFIDDEFGELLKKIPSQNIVVMVDACHSGTGTKTLAANRYAIKEGQVKARGLLTPLKQSTQKDFGIEVASDNYISLAAAQDNQYAIATSSGSIFTKALLDSFESLRKNNTQTTWKDIFDRTKSNVAEVNQTFVPNLTGNMQLAGKAIRFVDTNRTENRVVWQETMAVVQRASGSLAITAPQQLKEGEFLTFKIDLPKTGYLNVVSVGPTDNATVLYPNPYVKNNQVTVNSISIPTPGTFNIRAKAPLGKTLVAAFLTEKPIDLQKSALGNRDVHGVLNNLGSQTISGIRSLEKEATKQSTANAGYLAGYAEVNITAP